MHAHAFVLGLASLPLLACGGAALPVNGASNAACPVVTGPAAPLVVDWAAPDRRVLEARMAAGIAVVSYDCTGIHLLPDCHVEGGYGYVGAGHDAQVVRLSSIEEIRANLPATGAALQWPALSEIRHGSSIDLAFVTAGRRRATRGYAIATELVGDCAGATHFVREATVGAFAVDDGASSSLHALVPIARARSRDAANVFAGAARGGSILSATERRVQGAIAACAASRRGDETPPDGCDAVYRLDLAPIDARPLGEVDPGCGGGTMGADGKCIAPADDPSRPCNRASYADCNAQCSRGEQRSCFALGWMYENGRGVEKSLEHARFLYEGACRQGTAVGCRGLAWLHSEGIGVPKDPEFAILLYQRACDGGDADACSNLGHMYGTGEGVSRDFDRAFQLSRKGCDGGDPNGCNSLGMLIEHGWGVPQNPALAAAHFRQACDGGNAMGCANLGDLFLNGRGVSIDRAQGLELLRRGCVGGNSWGCEKLQALGAAP